VGFHHAMEAAIGRELRTEYGAPKELTHKLRLLICRIESQQGEKDERN
jgi:hypothetical protein